MTLPPPLDPTTRARECGCGCGMPVKRRYLPGHDAKHKAILVAKVRDATCWFTRQRAVERLDDLDWLHFVAPDVLHGHRRVTTYRGRWHQATHIDNITWVLQGPTHQHSGAQCRRLHDECRHAGLWSTQYDVPIMTSLVWVTPDPWHLCPTCIIDQTWAEYVEWRMMKMRRWGAPAVMAPVIPKPYTGSPWVLEPDPPYGPLPLALATGPLALATGPLALATG
jgi:hypothetical protein